MVETVRHDIHLPWIINQDDDDDDEEDDDYYCDDDDEDDDDDDDEDDDDDDDDLTFERGILLSGELIPIPSIVSKHTRQKQAWSWISITWCMYRYGVHTDSDHDDSWCLFIQW